MSGKVWLVGAGPGKKDLLTLRGKEILEQADVVVYDALVGKELLGLIPESARRIYAGKRSGNHALKQEETNRILLEEAQKGNRVVRLKGGDPFLFGRGGEELELLEEHGIPFEVVPGVTSAFSVPAYCGIPVTHRDYCSSVHVITGHKRQGQDYGIDFRALAETRGTLIFLMGIESLPVICQGLLTAGMGPSTPAAVLEKGTTARQRRISSDLMHLQETCRERKVQTPAIIVVGQVCTLAERFAWYEKKPLAGVRAVVTRPRELSSRLSEMLREEGAEVWEIPAIRLVPDPEAVRQAFQELEQGSVDWIVFTSPSGVRIFMDQLLQERDIRILAGAKIAVIGTGSEKELRAYGLKADFVPSVYDGATLGRELAEKLQEGAHVLIPRAAIGNRELTEELGRIPKVCITEIAAYDTLYEASPVYDLKELILQEEFDYAVFTSASTVRGFAAAARGADLKKVQAICIGPQTAAAAKELGMRIRVAAKATLPDLVECVKKAKEEGR
ncbi:MAG: uroporphyrinogen-III C-methyltransferase [Parasporobacterium sp.]|nr:uroporphyrinogen-III C-methyltransferase [Parasporobacterium sp.]